MNKIHILLAAVVLIGGGVYLWSNEKEGASVVETHEGMNTEMAEEAPAPAQTTKPASAPQQTSTATKTISLSAHNYAYSQTSIRVKKGETITINLTVDEGFHNLVIDEFNVSATKTGAGKTTSVTFTPTKTGSFEYYCSIGSHRQLGMKGTLIVEK